MNNLKMLRKALGLKQEEVATRTGFGQSQYSRIERGICAIGEHREILAKALEVAPEDIHENITEEAAPVINEFLPVYGLPRIDGAGFSYHDNMQSSIEAPAFLRTVANSYAVVIYGNDMAPRVHHGDLVYVDPNKKPKAGGLCICKVADGNQIFGIAREYVKSNQTTHTVCQLEPLEETDFPLMDVELHCIEGIKLNT